MALEILHQLLPKKMMIRKLRRSLLILEPFLIGTLKISKSSMSFKNIRKSKEGLNYCTALRMYEKWLGKLKKPPHFTRKTYVATLTTTMMVTLTRKRKRLNKRIKR